MSELTPSGPIEGHTLIQESEPQPLERLSTPFLGLFEVEEKIGRGGMGNVFAGRHIPQNLDVAIKVITGRRAHDEDYRRGFANEVHAVASLSHPAIITVFDYGEIPDEAQQASGGELVAGSPYLVMELATEGTLAGAIGSLKWSQMRSILLSLLDALAHAHARGVIHRDIKPPNILLTEHHGRIVPKLTDFGLAFATERGSSTNHSIGTPHYMAPEQIQQAWRKHGAWSDLYALGCVAWEMMTGAKPFEGGHVLELLQAHLNQEPGQFTPLVGVPDGVEEWLRRLLEKDYRKRFRSAAEAARVLRSFDPIDQVGDGPLWPFAFETQDVVYSLVDGPVDETTFPVSSRLVQPMRMIGAGLGLFGLRQIPFVGRDAELDLLWRRFWRVRRNPGVETVVVSGSQGCGKSRLVGWYLQRIQELGLAHTLRATHQLEPAPTDGLQGMLAQQMRIYEASRVETAAMVREHLASIQMFDPYEFNAMTEILSPAAEGQVGDGNAIQFASPRQRYAIIRRYLERLGSDRPVVLFIDDAQWGSDAIDFVHFLQTQTFENARSSIFCIVALREDAEVDTLEQGATMESLLGVDGVQKLELGGLNELEQGRLVQTLLPLQPELALEVTERTSGNPMLAVELIGEWVQKNYFYTSETGFGLRPDVEPEIPDSLHGFWAERIDAFLEEYGTNRETVLKLVEVAAALGIQCVREEWVAVASASMIPFDDEVVSALVKRRVMKREGATLSFVHPIAHESVARIARDNGRWQHFRRQAAHMVESRYDLDVAENAERYGQYLIGARDYHGAYPPLVQAAKERTGRGEYRSAKRLLTQGFRCLDMIGAPRSDPRRAEVSLLKARAWLNSGNASEARREAEQVVSKCDEYEWDDLKGEALATYGIALQWSSDPRSLEVTLEALHNLRTHKCNDRIVAWMYVANVLATHRQWAAASEALDRDLRIAEDQKNSRAIASNHYQRCRLFVRQEDYQQALVYGEQAYQLFMEMGHFPASAACYELMAEIHRLTGELDTAATMFRKSIEIQTSIGFPPDIARINLANILRARGRLEEAEYLYLLAADGCRESGRKRHEILSIAGALACAIPAGNRSGTSERIDEIEAWVQSSDVAELDIAQTLLEIAEILVEQQRWREALRLLACAKKQWQILGSDEKVARCQELLNLCQ